MRRFFTPKLEEMLADSERMSEELDDIGMCEPEVYGGIGSMHPTTLDELLIHRMVMQGKLGSDPRTGRPTEISDETITELATVGEHSLRAQGIDPVAYHQEMCSEPHGTN